MLAYGELRLVRCIKRGRSSRVYSELNDAAMARLGALATLCIARESRGEGVRQNGVIKAFTSDTRCLHVVYRGLVWDRGVDALSKGLRAAGPAAARLCSSCIDAWVARRSGRPAGSLRSASCRRPGRGREARGDAWGSIGRGGSGRRRSRLRRRCSNPQEASSTGPSDPSVIPAA